MERMSLSDYVDELRRDYAEDEVIMAARQYAEILRAEGKQVTVAEVQTANLPLVILDDLK